MSTRSKQVAAVLGLLVLGALVFLVLRPGSAPERVTPAPPTVVKPPMVRAPPAEPPRSAPVVDSPAGVAPPDASVEEAKVDAADAPAAPDPLRMPKINHHPPPPRSMGARFLALERRYDKAREAWSVVRSHKNPAEQLRYDAMLNQIGDELSSGSRQAGAARLQDFVTNALDGVEP